jgi:hypothetical protein
MSEIVDLSHVQLRDRPLVVCDVDDVVLAFLAPFENYLRQGGHELLPRSFRLTGNIVSIESQAAVTEADVQQMIGAFFEAQESWQIPVDLVAETLHELAEDTDVIFLTAMPPLYQDARRRLLDRFDLTFPLIASRQPKGPIMKRLHAERSLPSVFIDDMAHNLHSVRDHVGDSLLIHMMPDSPLHLLAPKPDDGIVRASDWPHAAELIGTHIGRPSSR